MSVSEWYFVAVGIAIISAAALAVQIFVDARRRFAAAEAVSQAESVAFSSDPAHERDPESERNRLFNLYSKQIERYQQQTRSRATWSFAFAIIAMTAGFVSIVWGARSMLGDAATSQMVAGGAVASLGAAASAYITKTFLDVHRLSLAQLNHYFQQPVINEHILMAQRLADHLGDQNARLEAYRLIIRQVATLIGQAKPPALPSSGAEPGAGAIAANGGAPERSTSSDSRKGSIPAA